MSVIGMQCKTEHVPLVWVVCRWVVLSYEINFGGSDEAWLNQKTVIPKLHVFL